MVILYSWLCRLKVTLCVNYRASGAITGRICYLWTELSNLINSVYCQSLRHEVQRRCRAKKHIQQSKHVDSCSCAGVFLASYLVSGPVMPAMTQDGALSVNESYLFYFYQGSAAIIICVWLSVCVCVDGCG